MGEAIISRRGGNGNARTTPVNITVSTAAPSSPKLHDVWVKSSTPSNKILVQNAPPSGVVANDVWIRITNEYLAPTKVTNANKSFTLRTVSREYDGFGNKPTSATLLFTGTSYDAWVILGAVRQRIGTNWAYCPAYYWDGSNWMQISWDNFYVFAGSLLPSGSTRRVLKIAPDANMQSIEFGNMDTNTTIIRTAPNGRVFVTNSTPALNCYDNNLNLIWSTVLLDGTNYLTKQIDFDSDYNVYVMRRSGSTWRISRYNSDGVPISNKSVPLGSNQSSSGFVIDRLGSLVTAGSTYLYKWNPDWINGTLSNAIASITIGGSSSIPPVVDEEGNFYVNDTAYYIYRINSSLTSYVKSPAKMPGVASDFILTKNYLYQRRGAYYLLDKVNRFDLSLVSTMDYSSIPVPGRVSGLIFTPRGYCVDMDGCVYSVGWSYENSGETSGDEFVLKFPPDSTVPIYKCNFTTNMGVGSVIDSIDVTPGRYSSFPHAW